MKRIYDFDSLVIGQRYYVVCDIWKCVVLYCGHVHDSKKFTFTFADTVDDWQRSFNIVACKSRLKVYHLTYGEA